MNRRGCVLDVAQASKLYLVAIPQELIEQFVKGPMSAEAIQDASMAFKKALIERALGAELCHHLGYPQGAERPQASTNQRNGKSGKTILTDDGLLRLDIPRDRDGSFAPILIPNMSAVLRALMTSWQQLQGYGYTGLQ